MNFRSLTDLVEITRKNSWKLPRDIQLIVGVPRSGMLPASVLSLLLNKPLLDLDSFLDGRFPESGFTRKVDLDFSEVKNVKRILIVEDSVRSGRSLESVRARIAERRPDVEAVFLAIIADRQSEILVDIHFDHCPPPRIFEWNLMNSPQCSATHFDLDGVFCRDPTEEENDDGERYRGFLQSVEPLNLPGHPIGQIVTSRLEKYRSETEAWLSLHKIEYGRLNMLGGVTAEIRRRDKLHAPFKAQIYASDPDATLFVESNSNQAHQIARLSGKSVLDFANMAIVHPTRMTSGYSAEQIRQTSYRASNFARKVVGRLRRQFRSSGL